MKVVDWKRVLVTLLASGVASRACACQVKSLVAPWLLCSSRLGRSTSTGAGCAARLWALRHGGGGVGGVCGQLAAWLEDVRQSGAGFVLKWGEVSLSWLVVVSVDVSGLVLFSDINQ